MNNDALSIISTCDDWYANRMIEDFHKRKNLNGVEFELSRMNFAKRCCADDANLCEIISVSPEKKSASQEFIDIYEKTDEMRWQRAGVYDRVGGCTPIYP